MVEYFINRKAVDSKPNNNFKDLNKKAFPLYKAGHIQHFTYYFYLNHLFIKATALPEMKKQFNINYKLPLPLNQACYVLYVAVLWEKVSFVHANIWQPFAIYLEFCRVTVHETSMISLNDASFLCTLSLQTWHHPCKCILSTPTAIDNVKFLKLQLRKLKEVYVTPFHHCTK